MTNNTAAVDALAGFISQHGNMAFSGAVDWLCAQQGLDPHGEESLCLASDTNIILDSGLNDHAIAMAKAILDDERLTLRPLTSFEVLIVYGFDGSRMVGLPLAQRPPKDGYRKPHWLPALVDLHR
ncbi:MAG TPA: hypothetical protein VGF51_07665 [Acidimicrobiales bacterium]|jgi:hypothetical protein